MQPLRVAVCKVAPSGIGPHPTVAIMGGETKTVFAVMNEEAESIGSVAVTNGEPIVRMHIVKELRDWRILVRTEQDNDHVVDETSDTHIRGLVRIGCSLCRHALKLIVQCKTVFRIALRGEPVGTFPKETPSVHVPLPRSRDRLEDTGMGRLDHVDRISVRVEVARGELSINAFVRFIDAPIDAVEEEMHKGATGVGLAKIALRIPAESIPQESVVFRAVGRPGVILR